jgi:hypothetical protein
MIRYDYVISPTNVTGESNRLTNARGERDEMSRVMWRSQAL